MRASAWRDAPAATATGAFGFGTGFQEGEAVDEGRGIVSVEGMDGGGTADGGVGA